MCLVVFAVDPDGGQPLLLAANRDERHARPSRPAGWWADRPSVFGGRDLEAGGTWLAVDRAGRVAAVTNFRDPGAARAERSRGALVTDALASGASFERFAADLAARQDRYGPFSLLLIDGAGARYVSNRAPARSLGPGVHALTNTTLEADWPKLATARAGMVRATADGDPVESLLALMAWQSPATTLEERYVGSHFIAGPIYGTRCTTIVTLEPSGLMTFVERSFDASGAVTGEVRERFRTVR
jgi:uncharacterized protein with NRDE domain